MTTFSLQSVIGLLAKCVQSSELELAIYLIYLCQISYFKFSIDRLYLEHGKTIKLRKVYKYIITDSVC